MVFFAPFDIKNKRKELNLNYIKNLENLIQSEKKVEKDVKVEGIDISCTYPLTMKDAFHAIYGAAFFSGGGGGAKQWGALFLSYIADLLQSNLACTLVSLNGITDDTDIIPVACMGAPSSLDGDNSGFLPVLSNCSIQAYQKYTGNEMLVVCGVEVGPTNSIVPMYAAATITANGGTCFVLDGDLQGRAVLSLTMLGPYMFNGVNMSGTFYSYVLPLGAPVPAGVLSQENVVISGNTYTVVGMRVPDSSSSPADTEAFLGNVIQNAAPNTVITVVFGGLNARLLRANTVQYTPGVYTQICTPNTISRSVAMGRSIIDQDFKPILKSLTQQNANIVSEDGYLNAFQGAGGGTRSDIAVWSVETESGNIYNGFYNNETVLLTYGSKDFKHLFTTPNTIGIMSLTEFSQDGVNIYLGECLTNDEIASYFTAIPYLKIPVLLFQLPAANLLLNDEALNWITPNKWGLANQFPAPYPSLTDIPFISCPSIYVAPSYPKYFAINPNYRFTELKIVTNDEENSPTEDKPIEDDNTPKDINTKKKSGCCTIM